MRTVAVIGAGQMGSGIAQTIAQFGMKVLISDVDLARAEAGKGKIDQALGSDDRLGPHHPGPRLWANG